MLGLEKYRDKQLASEKEAEQIREDLAALFRQKSREEWVKTLNEREIPCAPVYEVYEVPTDPHVTSREMILQMETEAFGKLQQLANPIRMSHSPLSVRTRPPKLGEHTLAILQELGYSTKDRERLEAEHAI